MEVRCWFTLKLTFLVMSELAYAMITFLKVPYIKKQFQTIQSKVKD